MTLSHVNLPNFFLLGAGRSGSSNLYNLLSQHPEIFLTKPKEPSFFCENFQVIKNPINYFELYDSASNKAIRGEASHVYLSNPSTAKILKALFPNSKFVVILRNPADRAYSLYHWMVNHGFEYAKTFESALEKEQHRSTSAKFSNNCPQYLYNYLYFRSGLYGEQIKRYLDIFPREQFHILKFEDFIYNPINHLRNIFKFIGVDQEFAPHLSVGKNKGGLTMRNPGIHYLSTTMLNNLGGIRKLALPLLRNLNSKKIQPISKETRNLLLDKYSSDLQTLFDLTGISFKDDIQPPEFTE